MNGVRTMLFDEDDLHVGTIIEQAKEKRKKPGLYIWYVTHGGGRAGSYREAYDAIIAELER